MHTPKHRFFKPSMIASALALLFAPPLYANPTGAQVVNGSVSIAQPNASTLNITNSPGAIINWQGFSIGAGEVTRFIQQSASSAVLNRVVGPDISSIQGQLLSNGRVFLINPAGIIVGPNAMIDTAGFVGSALNLSNADFLAGKLRFSGDATSGPVINQGWIRTSFGGNVLLVAPNVENSGLIQTPGGELILAAGQKLTVSSMEQGGVQFEVQAPTDSVLNVGKLLADGGAVGVFAGTLKHSGDIRASALARDAGGNVVLKASGDVTLTAGSTINADGKAGGAVTVQSQSGTTLVSGEISAQGSDGKGGDVRVLGNRVGVIDSAVIDASGERGGGQVLIGGDYRGGNAEVQNAARTFTGAHTVLRADAKAEGDGGRVIVWSDEITRVNGMMSVHGGAASGNGGLIETSGKQTLLVGETTRVDLGSSTGQSGNWLLDPHNITVQTAGATAAITDVDQFLDTPAVDVTVSPATLAGLTSGAITLQANNDITFTDPVTLTNTVALTAQAGRSILVNANITATNANINITANEQAAFGVQVVNRDAGPATITMQPGTAITANGTGNAILTIKDGDSRASGNLVVANVTGRNVTIEQNGITAGSSILRAGGASMITATQGVFLHHVNDAGATASIGTSAEPIRVTAASLDAHTHFGTGGIFIDSPTQGLQIGGSPLVVGLNVQGVQTVVGGPVSISVNGTLTQFLGLGTATCGTGGGSGGPICAGVPGSANAADMLTLRATDMNLRMPVVGNSVILLPQAVGTIGMAGGAGTLQLSQTEISLINTKSLRIGERNGVGTDTSSSGAISFGGAITSPGTASIEFRSGGNIVGSGAATDVTSNNANITLNAGGTIDAPAPARLKLNPGTGLVSITAGNNVFVEQGSGDLTLGNWTISSPVGVELATTNGKISGVFGGTGASAWTLIAQGVANNIDLTGVTNTAAASLTLTPAGSTTFNSGTQTIGMPVTTTRPISIGGGNVTFSNGVTGANLTLNSGAVTVGGASTFNVLTLGASAGTATFNAATTTFNNGALIQGGTVAGSGALTINNGVTMTNGTLGGTGAININGSNLIWNGGTLSNTTGVTVATGVTTGTGNLTLNGILTTPTIPMTGIALNMGAGSVLNLTSATPSVLSNATISDSGTINLSGAGGGFTVANNTALNINAGGVLDLRNTANVLGGVGTSTITVSNGGTLRKSTTAGTSTLGSPAQPVTLINNAGGTIDVQVGTIQAAQFPTNAGNLKLAAGTTFSTLNNDLANALTGVLSGFGTINLGTGGLTNNGVIAPGASPGALTIAGSLVLNPTSTLHIELQAPGLAAGTDYDRLNVTGSVILGGNLNVTTLGGFVPTVGQTFNVVNSAANLINNNFANITTNYSGATVLPNFVLTAQTVAPAVTQSSSSNSPIVTDVIVTERNRLQQTIPDDDGEYGAPKRPLVAPQCT